MNIFGFRPFKGRFNLGNSDDIPTNTDGTLIGAVKQINADLTANGNNFYFDYKNGKYGYNTDPNRGAGTFSPFSSGSDEAVDISNAVQLTTTAQTATKDGLIFGSFSLSGGQGSSVKVEILVDNIAIAGTISGYPCSNIRFPIAQGQTYKINVNGSVNYNKMYYAPYI